MMWSDPYPSNPIKQSNNKMGNIKPDITELSCLYLCIIVGIGASEPDGFYTFIAQFIDLLSLHKAWMFYYLQSRRSSWKSMEIHIGLIEPWSPYDRQVELKRLHAPSDDIAPWLDNFLTFNNYCSLKRKNRSFSSCWMLGDQTRNK